MLGSVVHDPVGAYSPLRPGRVLRTNRAGASFEVSRSSRVSQKYAVRQMRLASAVLTVSSRSAGRVFSLWACPPSHIGRAGGRAGHLARPSLYPHIGRLRLLQMLRFSMLHGVVFGQSFRLGMCIAHRVLSMGLFSDETLCPVRVPYGVAAPPAYLSHNTPRYGRSPPAVLSRSDRLDADFRAGVNFVFTAF